MFVKYNPNNKRKHAGDCVVRAICKATGKDWLEVFDGLTEIARKKQVMPSDKEAYKAYLEKLGYVWEPCKITKGECRPTVEFIAYQKKRIVICSTAHHLVACGFRDWYDLFDSGDCSVYGYFQKIV